MELATNNTRGYEADLLARIAWSTNYLAPRPEEYDATSAPVEVFEVPGHTPAQEARRPRKWGRLFAAALSLGSIITACELPPTEMPTGPEDAEFSVRVVGDSITFAADGQNLNNPETNQNLLYSQLNTLGYKADIQARIGATTRGLAIQPPAEGEEADITVIALGTNDMDGSDSDPATGEPRVPLETAIANIEAYMEIARSHCFVFVGPNETATNWFLDVNAPPYNNALKQLAEQNNGEYMDWAEEVRNHPEYVGSDQVHLTEFENEPDGNDAYRQIIADGVEACADNIRAAA